VLTQKPKFQLQGQRKNIKKTLEITRHEHKYMKKNETREKNSTNENKDLVPVIVCLFVSLALQPIVVVFSTTP
jgi:hypothetical protein